MKMDPIEVMKAIADLFPLVFSVVVLVLGILYRKPLTNLFQNLSKFLLKRGDTEFLIERIDSEKRLQDSQIAEKPEEGGKVSVEPIPPSSEEDNWFERMLKAFWDKNPEEAKAAYESLRASKIDKIEQLRVDVIYNYFCSNTFAKTRRKK
jgi:folylpolyglutamate synthase/dihydropteroate synthase